MNWIHKDDLREYLEKEIEAHLDTVLSDKGKIHLYYAEAYLKMLEHFDDMLHKRVEFPDIRCHFRQARDYLSLKK